MPDHLPSSDPDDLLGVSELVETVMVEHFPHGLQPSPTTAALSSGRAKVIIRDAANDDSPVIDDY